MIAFIASLPEWFIVLFIWLFLGFIMYSGYLLGMEAGLDRGHRSGFDLGRGVGRREASDRS
jgi:hypothetical protein